MKTDDIDDQQEKTLLYIESCLVDKRWKLCGKRMNSDDWDVIKDWQDKDLLKVERLPSEDIKNQMSHPKNTHIVTEISDELLDVAHNLRENRAYRNKPEELVAETVEMKSQ